MTALDDQVQAILAGTKGFVLDPRDLSTMRQDTAGTVPVTAVGDPVGRLAAKWGTAPPVFPAGNSTTARPLLSADGLVYDGVDDFFRVTGSFDNFRNMPGVACIARLIPGTTTGGSIFYVSGSTNAFERFGARLQSLNIRNDVFFNDAGVNNRVTANGIATVGVPFTFALTADFLVDRFMRVYEDGVQFTSIALNGVAGNSSDTVSTLLGIGRPSTNNNNYAGTIGRMVLCPFAPTPAQRATFEAWVAEVPADPNAKTLNFPNTPVVGEVFTAQGVTFVWNGTLWVVLAADNVSFATKAEAEAGIRTDRKMSPLRAKEAIAALRLAAPAYRTPAAKCFAWCLYNGQTDAIIRSFNVASLVDDGGPGNARHRITFINKPVDEKYIIIAICRGVTNHPVMQCGLSTSVQNTRDYGDVATGMTGGGNKIGFSSASPLIHASFWR